MPDMLVQLLKLPPLTPIIEEMREKGVVVRRALPFEQGQVRKWIETHFGTGWADEITVGYANKPPSVYIAIKEGKIVGFGAYECTCRAFFGPTGVQEDLRGTGIGKALLVACLWGLREAGYAYGIIGGAGPTEFYSRCVGAVAIPDSVPGIYADPLEWR